MKLTSTDAERINEIRKYQDEWDALEPEERAELALDRAVSASCDVRVLLELVDRILPDCYQLTEAGREVIGAPQ